MRQECRTGATPAALLQTLHTQTLHSLFMLKCYSHVYIFFQSLTFFIKKKGKTPKRIDINIVIALLTLGLRYISISIRDSDTYLDRLR